MSEESANARRKSVVSYAAIPLLSPYQISFSASRSVRKGVAPFMLCFPRSVNICSRLAAETHRNRIEP